MIVDTKKKLKELYEIDDYLWLEETVKLLKEKKFNELDLDNLIEELDDLGSEKRYKVESLLEQVIRHLLLLQYWENEYERSYRHWEAEITGFRTQLKRSLTTNLRNHLMENFDEIYQDALRYVKRKSGLDTFPLECPYSLDQLFDKDWFPEL